MSLLPSYTFKSQFFNNKSLFDDVVFNNKLEVFIVNNTIFIKTNTVVIICFIKNIL